MSRRLQATVLASLFALGCGKDKGDDSATAAGGSGSGSGSGSDTSDTSDGGPLTHDSDFALLEDDAAIYGRVYSAASYHLDVDDISGVEGFVTYTETTGDGTETCSAVLSVHTLSCRSMPKSKRSDP